MIKKDPIRNFSDEQREYIYNRADGKCEVKIKCKGDTKLDWDEWEADHIIRHEDGGRTDIKNGRVACKPCHEELNRQAMTKKNK